jgi:hypothetical protein
MKVYVIVDGNHKLCSIHSSLEKAQQSRLRIDVPEFDIQEWTVDETVFFGLIVDGGCHRQRGR